MRAAKLLARRASGRPLSVSSRPTWATRCQFGTAVSLRTRPLCDPQHRQVHQCLSRSIALFSSHSSSEAEKSEQVDDSPSRVKLHQGEPLFDKVNRLVGVPIGALHPLDVSLKSVDLIIDCGKLQTLEGMMYARDLLDRLLTEKRFVNKERVATGEQPMVIPANTFEKFLFGWAKLAQRVNVAIPRMKEVLDLMENENEYDKQVISSLSSGNETNRGSSCEPTVQTYNVLLRGLAEAARMNPNVARDAESFLDIMIANHVDRGWHTKPNTRSFTHVISAYANSGAALAGDCAEKVLKRMKEAHRVDKEKYELEFGTPYNTSDPEANVRKVVTPDHYVYSSVITAHARSGATGAAERAHKMLLDLIASTDVTLDASLFVSTINAWANKASRRTTRRERFEAAERAEELLWLMCDLSQRGEMESDVVDSSRSEGWEDEENDFQTQDNTKTLEPDVKAFNSVLHAWATSKTIESAPRAEALLQKMLESCMTDNAAVAPDCYSFNSVINAWARYGMHDPNAHEKAEELLNLQYDLCHSRRLDESAKPDTTTYSSVMNAWAKSNAEDKVVNTRRLLDTMLHKYEAGEDDIKPTVISFTSVLNAAAFTSPYSHANEGATNNAFFSEAMTADPYSIALQTYEELWNDAFGLRIKPDHFVIAIMLQVVALHTDRQSSERRQMVERVFGDACSCGLVSAQVVKALKSACPSIDLLERILGNRKLARNIKRIEELPSSWTRRVPKRMRFRIIEDTGAKKSRPKATEKKQHAAL